MKSCKSHCWKPAMACYDLCLPTLLSFFVFSTWIPFRRTASYISVLQQNALFSVPNTLSQYSQTFQPSEKLCYSPSTSLEYGLWGCFWGCFTWYAVTRYITISLQHKLSTHKCKASYPGSWASSQSFCSAQWKFWVESKTHNKENFWDGKLLSIWPQWQQKHLASMQPSSIFKLGLTAKPMTSVRIVSRKSEQCVERLAREGKHFSLHISLLTAHCWDSTKSASAKMLWKMTFPGLLFLAVLIALDNWALKLTRKFLMLIRKKTYVEKSALVTKQKKEDRSITEPDAGYFQHPKGSLHLSVK